MVAKNPGELNRKTGRKRIALTLPSVSANRQPLLFCPRILLLPQNFQLKLGALKRSKRKDLNELMPAGSKRPANVSGSDNLLVI
jgi:hypothetical protein